jgi:hypothetical protein
MAAIQRHRLGHLYGGLLNFAGWHCGSRFLMLEIASGGALQGYSVGDVYTAFFKDMRTYATEKQPSLCYTDWDFQQGNKGVQHYGYGVC